VAEETTDLAQRYNLQLLWIVDDNFLVDTRRALGIAEQLIKRNARFEWSVQASTNLVDKMTVDELKTLRRAGLAQVQQGADSGSRYVLDLMNKRFQQIETIYGGRQAAPGRNSAVVQHDFAYPGEREQDRRERAHDDGHLPQVSGRRVLTIFSRRIRDACHGKSLRVGHSRSEAV
jgi:radical SAM superfamily enzyme YgiQ (UPF0313 family)